MSAYDIWFKTGSGLDYYAKLKFEFYDQIDVRLRGVLYELDDYMWRTHKARITITCLNRSKEYNKKVGGSPWSAHLFGRAVDLRSKNLNDEMIKDLVKHLEDVWGDFLYVKVHDAGSGNHIHINIRYKYRKK